VAGPATPSGQPLVLAICRWSILNWHHCRCQVREEEGRAGQGWQSCPSWSDAPYVFCLLSPPFHLPVLTSLLSPLPSSPHLQAGCHGAMHRTSSVSTRRLQAVSLDLVLLGTLGWKRKSCQGGSGKPPPLQV